MKQFSEKHLKLRDDMMYLAGQLEALGFPLFSGDVPDGYYHLIESIANQYRGICNAVFEGIIE